MGDKVQNSPKVIGSERQGVTFHLAEERGRFGFLVGRRQGPNGTSLSLAPDGRPWTFHDPSPLVGVSAWREILRAAICASCPAEWVADVRGIDAGMAEWLNGLREIGAIWDEARGPTRS